MSLRARQVPQPFPDSQISQNTHTYFHMIFLSSLDSCEVQHVIIRCIFPAQCDLSANIFYCPALFPMTYDLVQDTSILCAC